MSVNAAPGSPGDAGRRRVARPGLRGVLFVCFALIAIVPIAVFGAYEIARWRRVQFQSADQQHLFAARAAVSQLGLVVGANASALEAVAAEVRPLASLDPAALQAILAAVRARHPTLTIYVADPSLTSVAADPPFAKGARTAGKYYGDRAYMQEALRTRALAISPVEIGRITGRPNIHMALPIMRPDGSLVAVVGAALDLVAVEEAGARAAATTPGLHLVVTDSTGRVLIHPDRAKETAMLDVSSAPLFAPITGDAPVLRSTFDDTGVEVRAAVANMEALGKRWMVAVFRPADAVAAEADATARTVLVVALLLLAIGLVTSAALAGWLASPIVRLAAIAALPAGDRPPAPAPRRAEPREISELLVATGAMMQRLDAYTEELEAKVEHRTAELGEAQRRLAVADRMSSLGTLAAGMAHEINNPLTYVVSNLDFARALLEPRADPAGEIGAALDDALDGAHRVRRLVNDLRTYSSSNEERLEAVSVKAVVGAALKLAHNQIVHRARLTVDHGGVPLVAGNEPRLVQIVLNLVINAAHAIPEGAPDRHEIAVRTFVGDDGRVAIAVRDTGCGIPAEVAQRIFDPFFTTKPVGVGTGLGLFICHGIVTSLGGEITVDSAPGKGSTFTVWLPVATEVSSVAAPCLAPIAAARRSVLAIDDDVRVGRSVERLARGHHQVTVVPSASEALACLAAGARFDVILCDIMMPGMDGPAFYEALAELDPTRLTSVVFMTGGTFTARTTEFLARLPNRTLDKPFSKASLLATLAAPPAADDAGARANGGPAQRATGADAVSGPAGGAAGGAEVTAAGGAAVTTAGGAV